MSSLIIGIAGGSGSGKSTLTQRLRSQFKDNISVIYHDDYYRSHDTLTLEQRAALNYDHPKAFDTLLLVQQLKKLKQGECIESPIYDFTNYCRTDRTRTVEPRRVVVVEGILIFAERAIRDLMDIKLFVDTDADVRVLRRIRRDVQERGRDLNAVIGQYLTVVKPMHQQFVEPSRHFADIVVLEGGENQVATDMLVSKIRAHLLQGVQSPLQW